MTRYHTLSCPDCQRQKMAAIPSTTRFYCCRNFDVTIELKRSGMLVDVVETWSPIVPETKKVTRGVWEDLELSPRELFAEFCGGEA
jgi:acyl-ACP thioesterase